MQRKIKFRFWHTEHKAMLQWDDVQDNSLQFLFSYGTLERMQYTGLKDKNGKEIYEGDIVHCDGYWDMYFIFDEEKCQFGVLATDWVVTQGKPHYLSRTTLSSYEVIGNIYENPDYLNQPYTE
jgi:uncharacterized phage protein (TIGR01671 family)